MLCKKSCIHTHGKFLSKVAVASRTFDTFTLEISLSKDVCNNATIAITEIPLLCIHNIVPRNLF